MFVVAAVVAAMVSCKGGAQQEPVVEEQACDTAVVYMTHTISPESLVKMYEALGVEATGRVAVKISTGEDGGNNFLQPALIEQLVKKVDGTIVECNTAYAGKRNTSADHWNTIKKHGFLDIAKVDIMDENGEIQLPVVDNPHMKYNLVGDHLNNYDFLINLAHFKGHGMAGFGGVLKNQSIGVASANGKVYIHTAGRYQKASTADTAWRYINETDQDAFCESMAVAAKAVADKFGKNILYISVMNNMSIDCDCVSHPAEPELQDVGILASLDPVALDQACLDIVFAIHKDENNNPEPLVNRINEKHGPHTVDYAAEIGLGTKVYKIVYVD